jgi:hypothetical protein
MRYFFLIKLLFFVPSWGHSQEKTCPFIIDENVFVDSVTSQRLIDTIKALPFKSYRRKGKIPRFIKKALACSEGDFRIASRGHAFNATDAPGLFGGLLPFRQLMYLGLTDDYMLLSYKHGGRGFNCPTILCKFNNKKIISIWCWLGFSKETKTKEDILQSLQYYPEIPKRRYAL